MTRVIQRQCISGINIFISPKNNNTRSVSGRINIFCTLLDITEVQSWLDFQQFGSFNICLISSLRQTPQWWDYHIYCFWFLLVLCCSCRFTRSFFFWKKELCQSYLCEMVPDQHETKTQTDTKIICFLGVLCCKYILCLMFKLHCWPSLIIGPFKELIDTQFTFFKSRITNSFWHHYILAIIFFMHYVLYILHYITLLMCILHRISIE